MSLQPSFKNLLGFDVLRNISKIVITVRQFSRPSLGILLSLRTVQSDKRFRLAVQSILWGFPQVGSDIHKNLTLNNKPDQQIQVLKGWFYLIKDIFIIIISMVLTKKQVIMETFTCNYYLYTTTIKRNQQGDLATLDSHYNHSRLCSNRVIRKLRLW